MNKVGKLAKFMLDVQKIRIKKLENALKELKLNYTVQGEDAYNLICEALGEKDIVKTKSSADLHPNLFEEE